MDRDSGFSCDYRSPGSTYRSSNNGRSSSSRSDNDHEEKSIFMIGEDLFSFDEDLMQESETGKADDTRTINSDSASDVESDDSGHFGMPEVFSVGGMSVANRMRHTGNRSVQAEDRHTDTTESVTDEHAESTGNTRGSAYCISLPITIPAGRFWPPHDAVDSIKDGENTLDVDGNPTDKTVLPQRAPKDLFKAMRAHALSIQPAHDPERLFGERPSRRRYRTGQAYAISQEVAPPQSNCEGAYPTVAGININEKN